MNENNLILLPLFPVSKASMMEKKKNDKEEKAENKLQQGFCKTSRKPVRNAAMNV